MQEFRVSIEDRIKQIRENIAVCAVKADRDVDEIQLMAVTKTVSPELVNIAVDNGIRLLGENRAQEYLEKYQSYKLTYENIHFIGHLQTNKVKYIIDKVSMIESVDSISLLDEIDLRAGAVNRVMPILLEVNIGDEASKSGFSSLEIIDTIMQASNHKNIAVEGLMCIPPKENSEIYFDRMSSLFCKAKALNIDNAKMKYLSMGTSGDYQKAILHNANIVRLGSAIFGERNMGVKIWD